MTEHDHHEPAGSPSVLTDEGAGGLVRVRQHSPGGLPDTPGLPSGMVRVRLDLEYDGTDFVGWATQPGLRSVEETLQEALARVTRQPFAALALTVAGRTDSGVHATGQVAHVDLPIEAWERVPGRSADTPAVSLVRRLRGVLPPDVRVRRAEPAAPGFDARFSALRRRYAYRVGDGIAGVPPLRRFDVLGHRGVLDVPAMHRASVRLQGLNDFAAYCRPREGATTIRHLLEYSWSRDDAGFAVARVIADAFCHSMVRALVGAALAVGEGRRPQEWPEQVLAGRRRDSAVGVVPALGLTLEEVYYPGADGLAARAQEARATRRLPGAGCTEG